MADLPEGVARPSPFVSRLADIVLLLDAELTSELTLALDTTLALDSVRALAAGGCRLELLTTGEGAEEEADEAAGEPLNEDLGPRTDVLAGVSRLKLLSARMEARTALSLFNGLSLPRKDCLAAALRLKAPSAGSGVTAAGRARVELLVDLM